jgi:signal transduction histidine kinase
MEFEHVYRSLDLGSGHSAALIRGDGTVLVEALAAGLGAGPRHSRASRSFPPDSVGTYRVSSGRNEPGHIGSYARARGAGDGLIVDVSVPSRQILSSFLQGLAVAALEVVAALIILGFGARLLVIGLRRRERLQADLARATALANTARADAEKANRAKSDFLARMSHELRTPLNAVIGFGQMLELDLAHTLTTQQRGYSQDIVRSGEHLLKLVNDILDLSGVEAGRVPLSLERLSVAEILAGVVEIMMPVAAKAGVALNVAPIAERSSIHADALRLRQALINLVGNAIKYNHHGGTITLSSVVDSGRVRLVVTDTGRGIPAERQAELFEPFHRLGAEYTAVEGTGLGLALAKRLVEAMGGSIGFVSTVGEGSSFWLDFPSDTTAMTVASTVPPQRTMAPAEDARAAAPQALAS